MERELHTWLYDWPSKEALEYIITKFYNYDREQLGKGQLGQGTNINHIILRLHVVHLKTAKKQLRKTREGFASIILRLHVAYLKPAKKKLLFLSQGKIGDAVTYNNTSFHNH